MMRWREAIPLQSAVSGDCFAKDGQKLTNNTKVLIYNVKLMEILWFGWFDGLNKIDR